MMSPTTLTDRPTTTHPWLEPSAPRAPLAPPARPGVVRRHPVLSYYVLTFAVSWGGLFLVLFGRTGIQATSEQAAALFPIALLVTEAGPLVAGLLLTGLAAGRAGFADLLARLTRWRVDARWYAVALLTVPALATAILLSLSLASPVYVPALFAAGEKATLLFSTGNKATLVLSGVAVGLVGGLMEELGWTGFAIPRLRLRRGILATGLVVGFLWGAWHVPATFWGEGDPSGAFSLALFLAPLLFYVAVLPAYRVLMVWVYDRSRSLLLAMLMHASLIATTLVVLQPAAVGLDLAIYYVILAAALWAIVAAVVMADRRRPGPLGGEGSESEVSHA